MGPADAPASLDDLVQQARAGSPDAWEAVYVAARPQLFRFARLRLATDDQAEDAVSETVARAIAAIGRVRPDTNVMAWLVGICRNVVHEAHRAGARQRRLDPAQVAAHVGPVAGAGPEELAVADHEAERLRRCFDLLADADQELLSLRVLAGLDAEATAAVLGKRAGAVRMAQSRALARLRTCVTEEDR